MLHQTDWHLQLAKLADRVEQPARSTTPLNCDELEVWCPLKGELPAETVIQSVTKLM